MVAQKPRGTGNQGLLGKWPLKEEGRKTFFYRSAAASTSCCLLDMQQLISKVHHIRIMTLSCHCQKMHQCLLIVVSLRVPNLFQVCSDDLNAHST